MSETSDIQRSVERMRQHMELRGMRPNTDNTLGHCARGFLTRVRKVPAGITTKDVEGSLLEIGHQGRFPRMRFIHRAPRGLAVFPRDSHGLLAPSTVHHSRSSLPSEPWRSCQTTSKRCPRAPACATRVKEGSPAEPRFLSTESIGCGHSLYLHQGRAAS